MREPEMLDFPLDEYKARLEGLTRRMKQQGMDAVFLTAAENLRYFTGLQSVVWSSPVSTPGVLLITADGNVTMISSRSSQGPARETTWLEEEQLRCYGVPGAPADYETAILEAFRQAGVMGGCVGMEYGTGFRVNLQAGYFFPVKQALEQAGTRLVDAARLLWELRTVKSPREIACVRRTVQVAEKMFDAAFNSVVLDKSTERDLMNEMGAVALEEGCEDLLAMVVRFGLERMMQINCPASDKVIITNEPHAILHLDGGPCYKGYYGDIIRQAVVGGLTPEQREYEKYAIESIEEGLAVVRPGVPVSEVSRVADACLARHGVDSFNGSKGWSGHGIGLDVHEEPQVALGSDYVLQAGMTLSLEPSFKVPGVGAFCNEQNFVVTETGYELLSCSPMEMRVLR